jgi:branched-chain amino acid transport system ATP-binding protein
MIMQHHDSTTTHPGKGATPAAKAGRAAEGPTKPPAHDIVSALLVEHRHAGRLLDVLEDRLAAVARGEPVDREAFHAGMTYMTQHLDGYHHLREDAMFARLVERDPHLAKVIEKVKGEHRSIGATGKRLLGALERLSRDGHRDEGGVVSGVRDYVGAMRRHMAVEEDRIFARARQVLDQHDLAEIDRAFMHVIDPIFEASVRDAYAAYSPLVRLLAEQPAVRQALGALESLFESAVTLGEALFGETSRAPGVQKPARAEAALKAPR